MVLFTSKTMKRAFQFSYYSHTPLQAISFHFNCIVERQVWLNKVYLPTYLMKHGFFSESVPSQNPNYIVIIFNSKIYFQAICVCFVFALHCDGNRYAKDQASSDYRSKQLPCAPVPSLRAEELSMLFHMQFMIPEGECLNRERRSGRLLHPCYLQCVNTN